MEVVKTVLRRGTWCILSILALLSVSIPAARAASLTGVRITCAVCSPAAPAGPTMAPNDTRQYTAFADFDDGSSQNITAFAEWTTSDSRKARLSTTQRGLVTARDPGQVEVRAALLLPDDRKEKTFVLLTVFAGPIVQLKTRPNTKKLEIGLPTQFTARAVYQINNYEADVTAESTFSSSNPAVASVLNTGLQKGLVTPLAVCPEPCNVVITAHHPPSGFTNTDGAITVAPQVTHIAFDDDSKNLVLGVGMSTQLDVYAYRVDNTRSNISDEVTWAPQPSPLFTIGVGDDEGGVLTGLADGEAVVHAFDPRRNLNTNASGGAIVKVAGVLQSLEVTPAPFRVGIAEEKTASARGRLSSGLLTSELRKFVNWTIGNPALAELGSDGDEGKITGLALGQTTLRAVEPVSNIASPVIPLEVRGAITSVSIEPSTATVARNIDFQLTAYANRSDNTRSNISGSAEWHVSNPSVVQIGVGGKIHGLTDGTATISAVEPVSGKSSTTTGGDATVTVSGNLLSIEVPELSVPFLETRKAEAIGHLSTGGTTSDLRETVQWTVDSAAIATVGPRPGTPGGAIGLEPGEVEGLSSGTTTLRAREPSTGITSTAVENLEVQGAIVSVNLEAPNNGLVPLNSVSTFKARATLTDGKTSNISDKCTWTVDHPAVASVDNVLPKKGEVTGLVFGGLTTVRIDCRGLTDSQPIQVIGNLVSVTVEPPELEGRVLREKQFRAYGNYVGTTERLDITRECRWSSTNPAVAEVEPDDGLVLFLSPGEALIVATAASGQSGTAQLTVVGGVEELKLIPSAVTMRGSTQRFFRLLGTLDSGEQQSLGSQADWTTDNPNVARPSDREGQVGVVIAGPGTGTATITATLPGGKSSSSVITVNALLMDLWMRRQTGVLRVGRRSQPPVRGLFTDNTQAYIGKFVELRTSNPAVARVITTPGSGQRIEGVAPGTAIISAFDPVSNLETSPQNETSPKNLTLTVTP
jgi:hypothetical protein